MPIDWSKVKSPLDHQRASFDALVGGSAREAARVLQAYPQYKWTKDFVASVRAARIDKREESDVE